MKIALEIIGPVDGSGGKLLHAEGKADGAKASLIVQKKEGGDVCALVLPKKWHSFIGSERVIGYQGHTVCKGKGKNGEKLTFDEVEPMLKPKTKREDAQAELLARLAESETQNTEMKGFIEQQAAFMEEMRADNKLLKDALAKFTAKEEPTAEAPSEEAKAETSSEEPPKPKK